jgi:hypothetical protein
MKKNKHHWLIHTLDSHLKSTPISVAIDILVILSILLNVYNLVLSDKMDNSLNKMDSMLDLMNSTLQKNSAELDSHIKSTYPNILAAHMISMNSSLMQSSNNDTCIQP